MIVIEKSWGYEEILYNLEYCSKKLVYTKPIASSLHFHNKKHETFVVGSGEFILEPHSRRLLPGSHVVLPPGQVHRLRCVNLGFIVESSTHDDPSDCVRLIPSECA